MGREDRAAEIEAQRIAEELERHERATRIAEGLQRRDELLREREQGR